MSITNYSNSIVSKKSDQVVLAEKKPAPMKVLEEDEYLGRMAKIIRRDFFSDIEFPEGYDEPTTSYRATDRSSRTIATTPGTDRTQLSTTSSLKSRRESYSLGLNDFLGRYTSEDNAYFEKLQRKELKRHRNKYPWLYKDKDNHNKRIQEQLKLPSIKEQATHGCDNSSTKMIDWPYNPKNSLFYPPKDEEASRRPKSTINYRSNNCINQPLFKMPMRPRAASRPKSFNRASDKIGIDGKLLNGSETPMINGYSLIPPPETPKAIIEEPQVKSETNRFYIPCDSPRDELAHRVYQDKVANNIRTPKMVDNTPVLKTPSFRKGYADFSFSPERVKNLTPSLRRK